MRPTTDVLPAEMLRTARLTLTVVGRRRASRLMTGQPQKIGIAAVLEVLEQRLEALAGALAVVLVEFEVAVAPVDRPGSSGPRGAQARDREQGVVAEAVSRWADLHDVDVPLVGVGLDPELIPEVFGARAYPQLDALKGWSRER